MNNSLGPPEHEINGHSKSPMASLRDSHLGDSVPVRFNTNRLNLIIKNHSKLSEINYMLIETIKYGFT